MLVGLADRLCPGAHFHELSTVIDVTVPTLADGHAYLNWAERQAQLMAAKRAGRQPVQASRPANGFGVAPEHAHSQLLVVYRAVFKSPQAKDAYNSR